MIAVLESQVTACSEGTGRLKSKKKMLGKHAAAA